MHMHMHMHTHTHTQECRNGVALFDMSFMTKFLVEGRDAGILLNRLSTSNVCTNDGLSLSPLLLPLPFVLLFLFLNSLSFSALSLTLQFHQLILSFSLSSFTTSHLTNMISDSHFVCLCVCVCVHMGGIFGKAYWITLNGWTKTAKWRRTSQSWNCPVRCDDTNVTFLGLLFPYLAIFRGKVFGCGYWYHVWACARMDEASHTPKCSRLDPWRLVDVCTGNVTSNTLDIGCDVSVYICVSPDQCARTPIARSHGTDHQLWYVQWQLPLSSPLVSLLSQSLSPPIWLVTFPIFSISISLHLTFLFWHTQRDRSGLCACALRADLICGGVGVWAVHPCGAGETERQRDRETEREGESNFRVREREDLQYICCLNHHTF